MGWSAGTYTKWNGTAGWSGDAASGIGIEPGRHDSQDADFATGINTCLAKDGQNAMTGDLNMGTQRIRNLTLGTAAAPFIYPGTDSNTGVYSPGADLLAITAGGAEIQRWTPASGVIWPQIRLGGTNGLIVSPDYYGQQGIFDNGYLANASGAVFRSTTGELSGFLIGNSLIRFYAAASGSAGTAVAASDERVTVNLTGVGINQPTPTHKLHVVSESNTLHPAFLTSSASGDVGRASLLCRKFDNNSTTSQIFVQFEINNTTTGSGQINANGASQAAFGSYSDITLKENITNLPSMLDSIKQLRPVEFDYKDGSGHQIGFIAQEVQEIFPDIVGADQNGLLMISGLGKNEARLIKAVQELAAKVEALEAQLAGQ